MKVASAESFRAGKQAHIIRLRRVDVIRLPVSYLKSRRYACAATFAPLEQLAREFARLFWIRLLSRTKYSIPASRNTSSACLGEFTSGHSATLKLVVSATSRPVNFPSSTRIR